MSTTLQNDKMHSRRHNGVLNSVKNLSSSDQPRRIGIVAGWGRYPEIVAEELQSLGHSVFVAGIRDHASESLRKLSDEFRWFGVAKLGQHQRFFLRHRVDSVLLAGKLFKHRILYNRLGWIRHLPDWRCLRCVGANVVLRLKPARDDSLLGAIVDSFEQRGLPVIAGTDVAPSLLAQPGVLTSVQPSQKQLRDMRYGWRVAKQSGLLDIGQTVTVRDETVLAVEAIEGTDACIERTGQLCSRGGFTMIKVAKPNQDQRFDMPTVGPLTIEQLKLAGGSALCIEANQTILIDREETLRFANKNKVAIVSWTNESAGYQP